MGFFLHFFIFASFVGCLVCQSFAEEAADLFSYRSVTGGKFKTFISSNVEGLFEGFKSEKKISEQISVETLELRSGYKVFDSRHRNILENQSRLDVIFSNRWFARAQLGITRQERDDLADVFDNQIHAQRMASLGGGFKEQLGQGLSAETYLGVVRCVRDQHDKFYPVFGASLTKQFDSKMTLAVQAAQEVQAGGSFTGMYGNQVFRKLKVHAKIPLLKKLTMLWDAGIGFSEGSFSDDGSQAQASVGTLSASVEYALHEKIKGSVGYSHRSLMNQSGAGSEGHMMSAALSFASF